jgi:hypothetical protein
MMDHNQGSTKDPFMNHINHNQGNRGIYTFEDLERGHISQQRNELKVLINSTQGGCSIIQNEIVF